MVAELNIFGVIGLLHFHKGILPAHLAAFLLSKAPVCLEGHNFFFFIRKKMLHKNSVLFYTLQGCWGRDAGGGGDRNLHKCNRGNMLLT